MIRNVLTYYFKWKFVPHTNKTAKRLFFELATMEPIPVYASSKKPLYQLIPTRNCASTATHVYEMSMRRDKIQKSTLKPQMSDGSTPKTPQIIAFFFLFAKAFDLRSLFQCQ